MLYLPKILSILKDPDYIPLSAEKLAEKLKIQKEDFRTFRKELNQHLRTGTLVKLKKNRVCLPRDADLITGIIRFRQSGSATLMPDVVEGENTLKPFQINAEDTAVAMHKDRVVCRIKHERQRYRSRQKEFKKRGNQNDDLEKARVIRILERANETLTGTLKRSRMFHFVIPSDPRIIQDILVPDPETTNLDPKPKIDDKVIVKLAPWEQRHLNPEGEIIDVLGETHTPFAEYQAILHQYDLNPDFPDEVMVEVENLPEKVPNSDLKGRRDIRDEFTLTIDPQDAKDFDDALSLKELDDGTFEIGIHIADVISYVKSGTLLDKEASKRGNSTYLVGKVIPMLPHALSNGLCSLVENEDRLTKSVFLKITPKGKIIKTDFANTVIRSNKRLTYEQAYAMMFEQDLDAVKALPVPPKHQTGSTGRMISEVSDSELRRIQDTIKKLWTVASHMRRQRIEQGSLELDMPESKIYVDKDGWADKIVKIEQDESHQLIEEFMLAANESVAKSLNQRNLPAIHRVHDEPDPEKLDEFGEYLATYDIKSGDLNNRQNLNKILKLLRTHPQGHLLRIQFLRSLKQACYRASPDGHFGLAKKHYTHFTSPIRRYSDLVVHRIFARNLVKGGDKTGKPFKASALGTIAQHLSLTEQNSTEAERESNKIKLLEFFERELDKKKKTKFKATILDIRNHGMFVELNESMAYGLVHISTLTDDLYKVNRDQNALIGRRKGKRFMLGDTIKVSVSRLDRFKRQIDFKVAR